MDRPSRKTKVVNYTERNGFDDDDDDDFAFAKAPPSKKSREDVRQQEPPKLSSKSSSQEISQKSRKPLEEKLLARDLEAAITLSLLNNAEEITNQSSTITGNADGQLPADENTDPSSRRLSNCSVDAAALGKLSLSPSTFKGLDEIKSEKVVPASSRQRRAEEPSKKPNVQEEKDNDYQPKPTSESESDEDFSEADESEDEEFTVKKTSKNNKQRKKEEKVAKKEKVKSPPAAKKDKQPSKSTNSNTATAAVSTPVRTPPAKAVPKRPAPNTTLPSSTPAISLSPAGGRTPKWNPPGQIGKSPTSSSHNPPLKSPGQGLRLGLSRRVRVKPLHPSVSSH